MKPMIFLTVIAALAALVWTLGCNSRASQIAIEAADRQAEQNQELARLDREHASSRRELIELHQQVQQERQSLSGGWLDLHAEQQEVIKERRTESLVVKLAPVLLALIAALFVLRLVSNWLDYQSLQTLVNAEPQAVARLTNADLLPLPTHPSLLPPGEPHESPRDDHDPGA